MKEDYLSIIIGANQASISLEKGIAKYLKECCYELVEVGEAKDDFVDLTEKVILKVQEDEDNLGIIVDEYGVGPFICASKKKGIVAANVSDERTAYMTRRHNGCRILCLGSEIIGPALALSIVKNFVETPYDGGRHQIRLDMLNKMC